MREAQKQGFLGICTKLERESAWFDAVLDRAWAGAAEPLCGLSQATANTFRASSRWWQLYTAAWIRSEEEGPVCLRS